MCKLVQLKREGAFTILIFFRIFKLLIDWLRNHPYITSYIDVIYGRTIISIVTKHFYLKCPSLIPKNQRNIQLLKAIVMTSKDFEGGETNIKHAVASIYTYRCYFGYGVSVLGG